MPSCNYKRGSFYCILEEGHKLPHVMRPKILGPCCECGKPCTEDDMIGNAMESDGLGSWPKLWCGDCINKAFETVRK
jgi:hypothetical protein